MPERRVTRETDRVFRRIHVGTVSCWVQRGCPVRRGVASAPAYGWSSTKVTHGSRRRNEGLVAGGPAVARKSAMPEIAYITREEPAPPG
jgi:hypothetical protein